MLRDQTLQVNAYREPDFLEALFTKLIKQLQKLQFVPGSIKRLQSRLISEQELIRAHNYERLTQFILTNREYVYRILEAYPEQRYAKEWDEQYKNLNLEYFLILATHYQAVRSEQNVSWVMYDEGFYRDAVKYVIDDKGNVDEKGANVLHCMPQVDLLFYIDAGIETCMSRLKTRPAGVPRLYRKFEHNLYPLLMKDKLKDDSFFDYLNSIGRRVARIDNDRPLQDSFAEVAAHLDKLYLEKSSCRE
jgi:hypothetical protein